MQPTQRELPSQAESDAEYSEAQLKLHRWYEARYDSHVQGRLRLDSKVCYLGHSDERVCRYCGKTAPEVTFKNVSHAFPELIGNKCLRDPSECDSCNKHFSKMLDDEFAKWSLPRRAMELIGGARGVPTLKGRALRIEGKPDGLQVSIDRADPRFRDDPATKTLTLELPRQSYVPIGVYKSLVKMAIAVMDDKEGSRWPAHKGWLLETVHSTGPAPLSKIVMQTIAGPVAMGEIYFWLFTRTPGVQRCPQVVFAVQFGKVLLQVHLLRREDEVAPEERFEVAVFPSPWATKDRELKYGPSGFRLLDMSSTVPTRGEVEEHAFSYGRVEPLSMEETDHLYGGKGRVVRLDAL